MPAKAPSMQISMMRLNAYFQLGFDPSDVYIGVF
jgi:hypothetical protein